MSLEIETFVLGPIQTNTYLVADTLLGEAVVIDPAWDGQVVVQAAQQHGWQITQLWLTHAHFDHLGGVADITRLVRPVPGVALHAADLPLWENQGGAPWFGMHIECGPRPTVILADQQVLRVGAFEAQVRHVPGHTPGHVLFYFPAAGAAFCGDLIFLEGIGRTDLPGGQYAALMDSIWKQVMTLPNATVLHAGHGPQTTVATERQDNPFLTNPA